MLHSRRMLFTLMILAMAWAIRPVESAAFEEVDALFVLSGSRYADTLRAEEAIEAAGGRVELIFPNRVIIGRIDRAAAAMLQGRDTIDRIAFGRVAATAGLARPNVEERTAIEFWNDVVQGPPPAEHTHLDHELMGSDALQAPPIHPDLLNRRRATQVLTPVMGGKIVQTVFFVESDGRIDPQTENWGKDWKVIKKQIITGLKYWTRIAPRKMKLKFVIKLKKPKKSKTSYEPINRPSTDEGLWVSELMTKQGFPATRAGAASTYFGQVYLFNEKQAKKFKAKGGAVSEFLIASQNDVDGKFTDGAFGYAYLGGWFTVMTYDNNGWGPDRFNLVQSHENGHLTGRALDEYANSDCSCRDKSSNGTRNGNCAACSSASCVMKDNKAAICRFTKKQIGW